MKMTRNLPNGARFPGFTLFELLLVIAVLALLSAVASSAMVGARRQAAVLRAESELAVHALALEEYKRRHGDYPRTEGPPMPCSIPGETVTSTFIDRPRRPPP